MTPLLNLRASANVLGTFLLMSSCLAARSESSAKRDQAIIERTKNILASSFDSRLPKVTLEYFLQYESGGASIAWEVNDCGEQTGNPNADEGRDFPICVEADFDANHFNVTLMIAVGTVKTGMSGRATLFSAVASDVNGHTHPMPKLGDLPAVVHRPMPRQPRDPMKPTRASANSAGADSVRG